MQAQEHAPSFAEGGEDDMSGDEEDDQPARRRKRGKDSGGRKSFRAGNQTRGFFDDLL